MPHTQPKTQKPPLAHRLQSRRVRLVLVAVWALAVAAASLGYALQRTALLDYNPINGDWQSYNAFRRVLDGQRPYADFANYVGMAPIVLNLPFLLLDGSFSASLFATSFTCNALFSLAVLLIFWLVTENAPVSLVVSAVFSKLVSSGLLRRVLGPAGAYADGLFTNLYTPSNSMRMARMFWPFLLCGLFILFDTLYRRRTGRHYVLAAAPRRAAFAAAAGLLCGLGVTWSNDFGLAALFSAAVLMVLFFFLQRPKAGRCALQWFALAAMAGAFASVFACTGGRPSAWLSFTTGVGQAQYWYFNGTGGRALLPYIFTNARLLLYTAAYAAFLLYCLVRLIQGRLSNRLALGGFLALCVLAATYAYIVSGSGYNFTEALEGCFWLFAAALALRGGLWLLRRWASPLRLVAAALTAALCLGFAALAARDALAAPAPPENAVYVQALGGCAPYPKALVDAPALVGDEAVFSLYATGLEAVQGAFQPSGYDCHPRAG